MRFNPNNKKHFNKRGPRNNSHQERIQNDKTNSGRQNQGNQRNTDRPNGPHLKKKFIKRDGEGHKFNKGHGGKKGGKFDKKP